SQRSVSDDLDVIDITSKDDEGNASDSVLWSMPDDELASLTGFETLDSTDNESQKGTVETFPASADKPTQSDLLGHLHEELCTLTSKVNQLESSITKGSEKLSSLDVQETLKDQLLDIILNPMHKEFNAFNKLESHRFVKLQKELSKVIKKELRVSIKNKVHKGMEVVSNKLASVQSFVAINSQHVQDLKLMFKDMVSLLEAAEVFKRLMLRGEGEQPPAQVESNVEQAPPVNKEKALALHASIAKSSEDDTLEKNVSNE
ncbi:hypothetical protein Tco_0643425, partial [Tanacetum coccineum]